MTADEETDLFVFAQDEPTPPPLPADDAVWTILIVDDEPDVHQTTLLALRGLTIEGRLLSFEHAYSAQEARALLAARPDIAVVLLDVVMESDHAGLDLIRHIREALHRHQLRIILRTGQPGYAPEVDTIRNYDINDYKTKSELTRTRLFTSLTVALRSYRQILQSEAIRTGLENIISSQTHHDPGLGCGLQRFAQGALRQICALFDVPPQGLVCAAAAPPGTQARVLAQLNQGSAVAGASLDDLVQTEALAPVQASLAQACTLRTQEGTCLYFPVRACNGVVAYLHAPLRIDAVDPRLFEVFCAHITAGFEKAFLEQKIADLAYRDPVLDLPNRNAFFEWAQTEVNAHTVLAQIDIDNFSDINTVLDLGFGDQVLLAVARRIQAHFPPPVRVARLGADIFGLLGDRQYVTPQAIAGVFAEPFNVGEHALRLSATTGLVACQDESANGVMALKNSAIAVKQAKMLVRSKHLYFDPAQSSAARDRLLMLSNLRAAFSANRLFVVFQPFVELSTSRIVGAEALLRWRSETGDFIPPDRFIPLAEESGLMVPIGEWIMRTAFREQRRFQAACPGTRFRMAINVSHVQFREPDFVDTLRQAMHDSGIDPASVEIELTESVAIEDVRFIVETLLRVRHLGVSIAIDDFGTGYSSLSVVRELPVHRLKIDRSFVNNVEADPSIARLVIGLARQLSIETIAEGIETVAQREILQALGCDDGQGYLFARPLPAQGLLELLQATCGPAQ